MLIIHLTFAKLFYSKILSSTSSAFNIDDNNKKCFLSSKSAC